MTVAAATLRFTGRVAIVTGAGGGLGREYALLLAERGAAVVVNDLGVSRSGEGKSSRAADAVVQEIKSKGGKAVPDYNSVEEGEKIVKTAIENFGRIDILINNAGILRDKAFQNITNEDWDIVHRIHLRGSYIITRAAWPYLKNQKYGRIIMTASGAGIYGNFGQTNYSSAKLGLLGLSNTLAIEGKKYNIHCNTIIPVAASRLTEDIMPPDILEQLKPNCVSPVVAWLCHESCEDNGGVFEAAGGWVGKYQWQRSIGKAFIPPSTLTPEAVRDNWDVIRDMSDSTMPSSVQEATMTLLESLSGSTPKPKAGPPKKAKLEDPDVFFYDQDKAILYALAVGLSTKEPSALNFLYEGEDDFRVLPTFGTITVMNSLFNSPVLREQMEKLNADPTRILHGEQYLELFQPFPPSAALKSKCRMIDVLDKGSGAVVIVEADTFNESNQLIMRTQWSIFLVGAGNFGGNRNTDKAHKVLPAPKRNPDAVIEEKTSVDQAALYRLCGDKNPMHIDPAFSAIGGFPEPILHGLCSLGYATRHVLKQYANYDVKLFKTIMARFASPILPGHSLRTEMWKEGNRIHFLSKCVETGKTIVSDAYIDLVGIAQPSKEPVTSNPAGALKSKFIFKTMGEQLAEMPDLAKKIQAVYEWNILKNGKPAGVWTVDLKTGSGRIVEGTIDGMKPGCTLIIDDDDMISMVTGKLDPQKAFMSGKLKLKGNIMLTQKLKPLLAARKAPAKSQPAAAEPQLKCNKIFQKLGENLKKNPELAESIRTVYQWNILKDGKHMSTWTLDLKNDSGSVYKGLPKHDKPDCTFILEDDLFTKIMDGTADPQKAFMSGKLKITGNVLASQKLQPIWEHMEETDDKASFAGPNDIPSSSPPSDPHQLGEMPATLKSDFVFQIFAERLGEEPELAKKIKVVYNWNIMQGGKKISEWTVDLKTGAGSIYRGPPKSGKADVTLTMDDEDVILMMLGKLNPQRAFMTGRLKIKGNIMLTQKLNQLWQEILKSGRAVELPILSAILAGPPFDTTLRSEPCFVELGKRVSRQPELVQKFNTVFEWNVTKNGEKRTQWILDLKVENCMLSRGPAKDGVKPSIFITVDDDAFADWILKKISPENVLSSPKTKIEGDSDTVAKLLNSFKIISKI